MIPTARAVPPWRGLLGLTLAAALMGTARATLAAGWWMYHASERLEKRYHRLQAGKKC